MVIPGPKPYELTGKLVIPAPGTSHPDLITVPFLFGQFLILFWEAPLQLSEKSSWN